MNIRPSHASACKGDLLIHTYCETRIALSPELSSEVLEFFNSFDSPGSLGQEHLEYETATDMLSTSGELINNFMKFFEIIDIEKNGIVTKNDMISFFEVMKAVS